MKIWDVLCFFFIIVVVGASAFFVVRGWNDYGAWVKSALSTHEASDAKSVQLIQRREARFNRTWQRLSALKERSSQDVLQLTHDMPLATPVPECCTLPLLNVQGSVSPMQRQAQSLSNQTYVIHVLLIQAATRTSSLEEQTLDTLPQQLNEIDRALDVFEKDVKQLESAQKQAAQKIAKANQCLMAYAP